MDRSKRRNQRRYEDIHFWFWKTVDISSLFRWASAEYILVHARGCILLDGEPTAQLHNFCVSSHPLRFRSVYIAVALIFWSFTVAEDPSNPIDDTAFTPGVVSHQMPFSLVFKPRIDEALLRNIFC